MGTNGLEADTGLEAYGRILDSYLQEPNEKAALPGVTPEPWADPAGYGARGYHRAPLR